MKGTHALLYMFQCVLPPDKLTKQDLEQQPELTRNSFLPVPHYVLAYARCLGFGQACYPCRCVWQQHFPPIEHGLEQHLQADVAWTMLAHALMDDDGNDSGRHASIVHLGAAQPQQHFYQGKLCR